MAEVNAKDLTTKTAPASTDSMLLFGTSTNEGAKITVDNLANNILERLATKTFPSQVGGSSAATILAQLATLNSNINGAAWVQLDGSSIRYRKIGKIVFVYFNKAIPLTAAQTEVATLPEGFRPNVSGYFRCIGGSGRTGINVQITTDGVIQAYVDSGTGTAINGLISFPTA